MDIKLEVSFKFGEKLGTPETLVIKLLVLYIINIYNL